MITNKIIAEKINVFLNLLFHLEDYITNQKVREEQLHITDNVKQVLSEVSNSPTVKEYFFKGTDVNIEYEDNDIEPEFRIMRLTEDKIKYIKMVNPQSFNQKNLELLNFFYNSTGEADMINDLIKFKVLTIIKFCLTQIMLKKYKEKEKEIYSKINFVLISHNNNKLLKQLKNSKSNLLESHFKKHRSLADMNVQLRLRPNFIIPPPPPIDNGKIKNKNNGNNKYNNNLLKKKDPRNLNNNFDDYYKTSFSKNYKLVQQDSNYNKNNENLPNINNNKTQYKSKIQISPSTQLNLIDLLHSRRKKSNIKKSCKITKKENSISINNNKDSLINIINGNENDKLPEKKIKNKRNKSENKKMNNNVEKYNKDKNVNSNEFDYNKIFTMFDALKKRGYVY